MIRELPLTVRRSIELLGLVLLAFVTYQLQNIIMPMLMALVTSIALSPMYRFLVRRKIPNSISIILIMMFMIIILGLIIFFIISQLKPLIYDFATIKLNIINHINVISGWLSKNISISTAYQTEMITQQTDILLDSAGNYLTNAINSVSTIVIFFGLFPIYTFLIIYYKNMLRKFLLMWFDQSETLHVSEVLKSIESIIHSYVIGLLIQFSYMTILMGGLLMLFGIKYALLIAVIFAVLNLIPYVGAFIGNIIGVLLTLSSSPSLGSVFTVLIIISVVQFLDNNILMPSIVGSKVRINALASIFGVIIGGTFAGISGMFLSLPLIASFKVIFDHTEEFKKWGVLFGDDKPIPKILMKLKELKK
jgi:predicted PurR-regulated permease PerM